MRPAKIPKADVNASAKVDPSHSYHLATGEKDLNLASKRSSNIMSTNKLAEWCELEGVPAPSSIQECLEECFQTWGSA